MPYNRDQDLMEAKEMAKTEPTLMLMKQNGLVENGWRGAEFLLASICCTSKYK